MLLGISTSQKHRGFYGQTSRPTRFCASTEQSARPSKAQTTPPERGLQFQVETSAEAASSRKGPELNPEQISSANSWLRIRASAWAVDSSGKD